MPVLIILLVAISLFLSFVSLCFFTEGKKQTGFVILISCIASLSSAVFLIISTYHINLTYINSNPQYPFIIPNTEIVTFYSPLTGKVIKINFIPELDGLVTGHDSAIFTLEYSSYPTYMTGGPLAEYITIVKNNKPIIKRKI